MFCCFDDDYHDVMMIYGGIGCGGDPDNAGCDFRAFGDFGGGGGHVFFCYLDDNYDDVMIYGRGTREKGDTRRDRQTDRQADRQTYRQTDRQADGQRGVEGAREKETRGARER